VSFSLWNCGRNSHVGQWEPIKSFGLWVLQKRPACALYYYCSNSCWRCIAPPAPTLPADRPRICTTVLRVTRTVVCAVQTLRQSPHVQGCGIREGHQPAVASFRVLMHVSTNPIYFIYVLMLQTLLSDNHFGGESACSCAWWDNLHLSAHTYDVMFRRRKVRDEFRWNSFCLTSYRAGFVMGCVFPV
jgi:hypothetical protein